MAWPKISSRFTSAALSGHSVVGLAFGALIYLICVTGTISVLVDELKAFEQPQPRAGPLESGALQKAVVAALSRERVDSLYVLSPVTPRQRVSIATSGPNGAKSFLVDPEGSLIVQRTPFTDFVTDLHMTLTLAGPLGSLVVGLAGTALLSLLFSGVLSHPRIFRDAFRLKLNGSERLREAELHNRLSVWGLPFHVVVTLTGALFALSNLAIMAIAALGFHGDTGRVTAPFRGPDVALDPSYQPLTNLAAVVEQSLAALPGSKLYYLLLEHPLAKGARLTVEVSSPNRLPRGEDFYYDASGHPIGRGRLTSGAIGLQAYSAAAQLHFGFFAGLPVRIAYVVLGSALSFISASGVTIWLSRQADQGKVRRRLRRSWTAWTWGVPLSLVAAALLSPVLPVAASFWSVAIGLQLVIQAARPSLNPMADGSPKNP